MFIIRNGALPNIAIILYIL